MTRHCDFKMETRRYGSGHTNFVQIVCGWCSYEGWFPAKNGGWAMRIFRAHGWKVGSKPAQHRCPKCFGKAMASRRTPDNPVIPKELGKAIKTAMMENHVREALMSTAAVIRPPRGMPAEPPVGTADPTPPAEPKAAPAPVPEPAVGYFKPVRGSHSIPGRTLWPNRRNAASAGVRQTRSVDGLAFFTVPLGHGWTWKHAADVTPEEKAAWLTTRTYGPRPMKRADGSKPDPGATVTTHITRPDGKVSVLTVPLRDAPIDPPEEEPPMTAKVTPIRKDPMPTPDTTDAAHAFQSTLRAEALDPNRQPTRDQRGLIHDELTKVYDPVDQRYGGSDSDKVLGARLDLPWRWVTDIRVAFFGDHDRNSQTEKQKKELDAAIIIAKAATSRLLEMAGEAETIEQKLMATRKLLGE